MRLPGGPVRRYKDALKINLKRCGINPNLLNSVPLNRKIENSGVPSCSAVKQLKSSKKPVSQLLSASVKPASTVCNPAVMSEPGRETAAPGSVLVLPEFGYLCPQWWQAIRRFRRCSPVGVRKDPEVVQLPIYPTWQTLTPTDDSQNLVDCFLSQRVPKIHEKCIHNFLTDPVKRATWSTESNMSLRSSTNSPTTSSAFKASVYEFPDHVILRSERSVHTDCSRLCNRTTFVNLLSLSHALCYYHQKPSVLHPLESDASLDSNYLRQNRKS